MGPRADRARDERLGDDRARQRDPRAAERGGSRGLKRNGTVAAVGVEITGREFCVGERVIARRNDRHRDIDNGTRATITAINQLTRALTVKPDGGGRSILDAAYVADHLEHAYALTGHGAQGATSNGPASSAAPVSSPPNGPTPPCRAPAPKHDYTSSRNPQARGAIASSTRRPTTPPRLREHSTQSVRP
jgi:hypothetical protein